MCIMSDHLNISNFTNLPVIVPVHLIFQRCNSSHAPCVLILTIILLTSVILQMLYKWSLIVYLLLYLCTYISLKVQFLLH